MARIIAAGLVAISLFILAAGCGNSSADVRNSGGASAQAGANGGDRAGAGENAGNGGADSEVAGMGSEPGGRGGSGGATGGTPGSGGSSGTGGGAAGSSGAAGGGSMCPASEPSVNSACARDGLDCSYGGSPFPECRNLLVCFAGKWAKGVNPGPCTNTPASICPAVIPSTTSACNKGDLGTRCAYDPGTLCSCVAQFCGGTGCTPLPSPQWTCGTVTTGCPAQAPNSGSACEIQHQRCQYEYCGLTTTCESGVWTWLFGCA